MNMESPEWLAACEELAEASTEYNEAGLRYNAAILARIALRTIMFQENHND